VKIGPAIFIAAMVTLPQSSSPREAKALKLSNRVRLRRLLKQMLAKKTRDPMRGRLIHAEFQPYSRVIE